MLKASALYLTIIVSLIITIILTALISTAYFYKLEYQKNTRYNRLLFNLKSGTSLLLSKAYPDYDKTDTIDLFDDKADSILIRKERWGIFDLGVVKSFTLNDTLKRSFFIGELFDDEYAIYLSDEDRPLSVSGRTKITGAGYLPKSGIKQAYVDGRSYENEKPIYGKISNSNRTLPQLDPEIIKNLFEQFDEASSVSKVAVKDSAFNSFYNPKRLTYLDVNSSELQNHSLAGKIILISDTILTIGNQANLNDILIYAPSIIVEDGFTGSCQLFATDSIIVGKNTTFNYPSCLGVLKKENSKIQSKIEIGADSKFSGILFTYEKKRSDLQTIISLGKNILVKGEVYSTGYVKLEKPVTINGKVSCNRFIMETPTTLYENYLIDVLTNRKELSTYYLSSPLFNQKKQNQILKWLN